MTFKHSLRFVEDNSSKRLLTGQRSNSGMEKLYHFGFVGALTVVTFGLWLVLLAYMKKKQFHPSVSVVGTNNPIDPSSMEKLLDGAGYKISDRENPKILINISRKEFMLITDLNVYYSLLASSKITEHKLVHGKIPIESASGVMTKGSMSDTLSIMIGNEVIGAMTDGDDPRIIGLLKCVAKDVREECPI